MRHTKIRHKKYDLQTFFQNRQKWWPVPLPQVRILNAVLHQMRHGLLQLGQRWLQWAPKQHASPTASLPTSSSANTNTFSSHSSPPHVLPLDTWRFQHKLEQGGTVPATPGRRHQEDHKSPHCPDKPSPCHLKAHPPASPLLPFPQWEAQHRGGNGQGQGEAQKPVTGCPA